MAPGAAFLIRTQGGPRLLPGIVRTFAGSQTAAAAAAARVLERCCTYSAPMVHSLVREKVRSNAWAMAAGA